MSQTIIKKMNLAGHGVLTAQDVRTRRNVRDLSFLYLAMLTALAMLLIAGAFLWSRLTVVNLGYEISKANTARSALLEAEQAPWFEVHGAEEPRKDREDRLRRLSLVHPRRADNKHKMRKKRTKFFENRQAALCPRTLLRLLFGVIFRAFQLQVMDAGTSKPWR
jgi:hypothetical protein